MSPWARASPIRTLPTAACSSITPSSSEGTPSMLIPSSFAWASSSGGVVRSASASAAAGRTFSPAKSRTASWNICCSSSGARSKRPRGLPRLLAGRFAELLGSLEGARGRRRRAEPALRRREDHPLERLADADPVEQARAGELVERCAGRPPCCGRRRWRCCRFRSLGLLPLASGFGLDPLDAAVEVGGLSLCVTHREASPRPSARNSTRPGRKIGLRKLTSTRKASGRRLSIAARQRALVHIPCAIARLKPSGFAVQACMWIGLRSPETAA